MASLGACPVAASRARWLLAACLLLLAHGLAWTQDAPSREFGIKAAFLFNFVRFADWPAAAFIDDAAPIRIGILGDDPFGSALEEIVRGETVRKRALTVQRAHQLDELEGCHLLFIARSEQPREAAILAALDQRPVLTVSDLEQFAAHGGVIGFYLEGNKVRFEINPASAQRKQLKLSAQLLRLGRIVGPLPDVEHP